MKQQSGNVLFLILISVALFAALSYAVTSSTRSGGGNASKEKAQAGAASLLQFATLLENTVQRLRVSNDCKEDQLDFTNAVYKRYDDAGTNSANSNAPADRRCHVFDPAGGNISPLVAPPSAISASAAPSPTNWREGHGGAAVYQVKDVGTTGAAGTVSANDLVFHFTRINLETCIALNELLGVANPGGAPPNPVFNGTTYAYSNGSFAGSGLMEGVEINGQLSFCSGAGGTSAYTYRHVILKR